MSNGGVIDIFDDKTSSISRLYREVQAEHHLVQERLDERPDTPGLTPRGFERWATLMIQAHPQQEYERLHKAVLDMPINNPDNRKERFPKEIPRRLFPVTANQAIKEQLEGGITTHCGIDLTEVSTPEPPRSTHNHYRSESNIESSAVPPTPTSASNIERDRQPYCSSVIDDEEDEGPPPNRPIERERKPYSAQPGRGKKYSESSGKRSGPIYTDSSQTSAPTSAGTRPPPPPLDPVTQDPAYLHPRGVGGIPRLGSPSKTGRSSRHHRSPSVGITDYRRSEGDLFRKHRSSFNGPPTSGTYPTSSMSRFNDAVDDTRAYRDDRSEGSLHGDRDRDRDREGGSRYRDPAPRSGGGSGWASDEDYYRLGPSGSGATDRDRDRGLLGGRLGNGGAGYDYDSGYPGGYR